MATEMARVLPALMMVGQMRKLPLRTTTTTTIHFYPPLPAIRKYINHYKASNPLNIEVKSSRSENYFLILGDWGKAGGPGSCQLAVATRMRAYVKEQKLRGKHLLFIASVGDNFYWTGATPEAWERTWAQPYGVHDPSSPLYQIPWLSLYLGCLNCLRPPFILPCQVRFFIRFASSSSSSPGSLGSQLQVS